MPTAMIQTADGTLCIRSHAVPLLAGDDGTAQTLALMWQKVRGLDLDEQGRPSQEGDTHPGVRAFALQATRDCSARDDWQQAQALYYAVQCAVPFRGEKDEQVQTPWLTLGAGHPEYAGGDCDDMTVLLCALMSSLGIPATIRTEDYNGRGYAHVYARVGLRDPRQGGRIVEWRPLDASVEGAGTGPGWSPPNPVRVREWPEIVPRGTIQDRGALARPNDLALSKGREPMLGFGFGHIFKDILGGAKGFAEGGPAGAAAGAAQAELKQHVGPKKLKAIRGGASMIGGNAGKYLSIGMGDAPDSNLDRQVRAAEAGINAYMQQRRGPVLRMDAPMQSRAAVTIDAASGQMVATPDAKKNWIGTIPNEDVAIAVSLAGLAVAFLVRR